MRFLPRLLPLLLVGLFFLPHNASAQNVSVFFGMGSAHDKPNATDDIPTMGGLFGRFGGDYMFKDWLGVGMEGSFRFSQDNTSFVGLKYRPSFYDFNAIFTPLPKAERVVPEFQAGIGWAKLSFYQNGCDTFTCSSFLLEQSNHFQANLAAGVRLYFTKNAFIRPEIHLHHVTNFFQFGNGWVPEYGASIGYTFGK